jgi:hypothetical protein
MEKNHTCKHLEIQGHYLDDAALAEIGPWMRWPYVWCSSLLIVATHVCIPSMIYNALFQRKQLRQA